jgi:putative phosphoesterase
VRIAALYDIHGNLPALQAVLDEVRAAGVDRIVVGGDVIPGPMARESLAALSDSGIATDWIRGNCESAVLAHLSGSSMEPMPESARRIIAWTADHLGAEYASVFASWPATLRLDVPGIGAVVFCHGTPRHDNEIFTCLTAAERLLPLFRHLLADLVVCGHTHMQFDRMIGATRVVNAGSVGMPFGTTRAEWALIGPQVELRHTAYDREDAARRIVSTPYPDAEEFASQNVLQSPSAEAMLKAFSLAELRYGPPRTSAAP